MTQSTVQHEVPFTVVGDGDPATNCWRRSRICCWRWWTLRNARMATTRRWHDMTLQNAPMGGGSRTCLCTRWTVSRLLIADLTAREMKLMTTVAGSSGSGERTRGIAAMS